MNCKFWITWVFDYFRSMNWDLILGFLVFLSRIDIFWTCIHVLSSRMNYWYFQVFLSHVSNFELPYDDLSYWVCWYRSCNESWCFLDGFDELNYWKYYVLSLHILVQMSSRLWFNALKSCWCWGRLKCFELKCVELGIHKLIWFDKWERDLIWSLW